MKVLVRFVVSVVTLLLLAALYRLVKELGFAMVLGALVAGAIVIVAYSAAAALLGSLLLKGAFKWVFHSSAPFGRSYVTTFSANCVAGIFLAILLLLHDGMEWADPHPLIWPVWAAAITLPLLALSIRPIFRLPLGQSFVLSLVTCLAGCAIALPLMFMAMSVLGVQRAEVAPVRIEMKLVVNANDEQNPALEDDVLISNRDIASATVHTTSLGGQAVRLQLTPEATKSFADLTSKSVGKRIAILVDNSVVALPMVRNAIYTGQVEFQLPLTTTKKSARSIASGIALQAKRSRSEHDKANKSVDHYGSPAADGG